MDKIFFSILIFGSSYLFGQRYDNQWILGSGKLPFSLTFQSGLILDFSDEIVRIDTISIDCRQNETISSVCDTSGKLLLYSNGCDIFLADAMLISGGDSINYPGFEYEQNCEVNDLGYNATFGMIILPKPLSINDYYIFHERFGNGHFSASNSILFSSVDMGSNSGKGQVTERNKELMIDSFVTTLSSVRHGNGRDWWVSALAYSPARFVLFQLTPNGVVGPQISFPDLPWFRLNNGKEGGGSTIKTVFSPDGTKFMMGGKIDSLEHRYASIILDFDRCTGIFSNPRTIEYVTTFDDSMNVILFGDFIGDKPVQGPVGCAFSPNNRFIYVGTGQRLFQFDLEVQDLITSMVVVGEFTFNPNEFFQTTINQPELAANGKIYVSCTNGTKYLHVVDQPNEKGANCMFHYRGVEMPYSHGFFLPMHPNYRLHEWAHSPCDSLTYYPPPVDSCLGPNALLFAPNPANDVVKIQITPCKTGDLRVWNVLGQLLFEHKELSTESGNLELIVRDWPTGSYFIEFFQPEKTGRLIRKLIVARKE